MVLAGRSHKRRRRAAFDLREQCETWTTSLTCLPFQGLMS